MVNYLTIKNECDKKAQEYQKKYNLKTNPVQKGADDEEDAFRHAFASAYLVANGSIHAKTLGDFNEKIGPNSSGSGPTSKNMDLWNNAIGREIGEEVLKEINNSKEKMTSKVIENKIAEKIVGRMKKGELITDPKQDTRKFENYDKLKKEGKSSGGAAAVDKPFTREEIGKMSREEFEHNESAIMEQAKDGKIKPEGESKDYSDYKNPESGSSKIYSREDIAAMSTKEYAAAEKEINAQMNSIGVPTNDELKASSASGSGLIYVEGYTKADGTEVKGYYRSK